MTANRALPYKTLSALYGVVAVGALLNLLAAIAAMQSYPNAPWLSIIGIAQSGFGLLVASTCALWQHRRVCVAWAVVALMSASLITFAVLVARHAFANEEQYWAIAHLTVCTITVVVSRVQVRARRDNRQL
jgi:hypothetical protein